MLREFDVPILGLPSADEDQEKMYRDSKKHNLWLSKEERNGGNYAGKTNKGNEIEKKKREIKTRVFLVEGESREE